MRIEPLLGLTNRWQEEAERYELDGVPGHAALLRRVAADLQVALDGWWLEQLTLSEAADETGLAYDTVQRAVADGRIPNAGKKNRPLVRRCDLHDRAKTGSTSATIVDGSTPTDGVTVREQVAMDHLSRVRSRIDRA